ncbi:hypothetical protein WICPIJ_005786 [Wickerhamomyces pijperi]|uniref:Uncharacterized protein n=1 Tax=Wickerhamomyces pijperi TaxID=599730 RepID=A0A9P8Q3C4_WICPI|nr:hypothetical protein WICPIJ_005786 [Wickerhamomyces pijperi]
MSFSASLSFNVADVADNGNSVSGDSINGEIILLLYPPFPLLDPSWALPFQLPGIPEESSAAGNNNTEEGEVYPVELPLRVVLFPPKALGGLNDFAGVLEVV